MAATTQTTTAAQPTPEAFKEIYRLLDKLTNSVALDKREEYLDCLTVFTDNDWKMKAGANAERFQQLLDKGNEDEMSQDEMDEFMDMVSEDGQTHVYHTMHMSEQALCKHNSFVTSL